MSFMTPIFSGFAVCARANLGNIVSAAPVTRNPRRSSMMSSPNPDYL
jgi:hypothetical protein